MPTVQSISRNREERRHPDRLDVPGAADYAGLTVRHIRRLVAERRIPHYKVGSKLVFDAEDLDAFLASNRREAR